MTPTIIQTLTPEFKKHFKITEVHSKAEGGQKKVFIVTKDGVKCALKLFNNFGKRDIRELEIYSKFKDIDGIPKVISIEDFDNDKVVFEEYIAGSNLQDIINEYTGNYDKIKKIIIKICLILKPIWDDNKIHRDIKLNNIMVKVNGDPVVIDFGIAQDLNGTVYTTHDVPKSWGFASPEQILNQRDLIDYRSDFFSLGVVAYCLYYNRKPFGDSLDEVTKKFIKKDNTFITDKDCKLNQFFEECLGISPVDRPRDLDSLLKTLK